MFLDISIWSGREDLNLRPLAPHASALPGCATPRIAEFGGQKAGPVSADAHDTRKARKIKMEVCGLLIGFNVLGRQLIKDWSNGRKSCTFWGYAGFRALFSTHSLKFIRSTHEAPSGRYAVQIGYPADLSPIKGEN